MRYILLAVAIAGITYGVATTASYAQIGIGPGGVYFGQPQRRYYGGPHMRYDQHRNWAYQHYNHRRPVAPHWHHDDDDEDEDE